MAAAGYGMPSIRRSVVGTPGASSTYGAWSMDACRNALTYFRTAAAQNPTALASFIHDRIPASDTGGPDRAMTPGELGNMVRLMQRMADAGRFSESASRVLQIFTQEYTLLIGQPHETNVWGQPQPSRESWQSRRARASEREAAARNASPPATPSPPEPPVVITTKRVRRRVLRLDGKKPAV